MKRRPGVRSDGCVAAWNVANDISLFEILAISVKTCRSDNPRTCSRSRRGTRRCPIKTGIMARAMDRNISV